MLDRTYISFLRSIQRAGFNSAVIAGGAIRDDFFKEDFKDLDVFLWHPECSDENISFNHHIYDNIDERVIEDLNSYIEPDDSILSISSHPTRDQKSSYSYGSGIVDIWNLYHYIKNKQIQFIFTEDNPITYVTEQFDIGLCMCYFDGIKIHYTNAFMNDFIHKTITICGKLDKKNFAHCIEEHLDRVKAKFPGYTVKVAKELEKFLTPELKQLL